jgi:ribosome-associated protein
MTPKELLDLVLLDLDDLKAVNISPIFVRDITPLADYIVIATGNSSRHVDALRDNIVRKMKVRHIKPVGVEGDKDAEWVLVDLGDVVIHIMQPRVRDFYNLEKLWAPPVQAVATA